MILLALTLITAAPVVVTDASLEDKAITEALPDAKIVRPPPAPDYDAEPRAAAAAAKQTCQEGRKLAVALKTQAAIEKYEQALNAYESALAGVSDYGAIRECLMDLASAWIDDDNDVRAAEIFARALMLDDKKGIDRSRYRPNVVARFQKVKKSLARSATGSATISSAPAGRDVVLDGKKRGQTPLSIGKLLPGEHWVLVQAPGFQPFQARVSIRAGSVERVDVILRPRDRPAEDLALDLARGEEVDPAAQKAARSLSAETIYALKKSDKGVVGRGVKGRDASSLLEAESVALLIRGINAELTPPPASAPASMAIEGPHEIVLPPPPPPRVKTHWALAALPFGIAQLVEKRYVAGAMLLITELGLLATNIACYVLLRQDRSPNGRYADVPRDTAFTWVVNVSFGLLIAEVIAGAIDGELHR